MPPVPPSPSSEGSRIAELERELAEAREALHRQEERDWRQRLMLDVTQETLVIFEKGVVIEVNPQFEDMFGFQRDEVIGRSALEFVAPESRELIGRNQMSGYALPYEGNLLRKDGSKFTARIRGRNEERDGQVFRVTAFVDLTEQKKAEEVLRKAAVHEELIRLQADLLARLSTPLLPIAKGALVLPLIGQINGTRAAQVLDTLTHGVVAHSARHAILDVTGVDTLDAQVAELLVSASKVVRLLGAQALLTGIRPDVARMLVEIGSDLSGLVTFATLEQGVAHALRKG